MLKNSHELAEAGIRKAVLKKTATTVEFVRSVAGRKDVSL